MIERGVALRSRSCHLRESKHEELRSLQARPLARRDNVERYWRHWCVECGVGNKKEKKLARARRGSLLVRFLDPTHVSRLQGVQDVYLCTWHAQGRFMTLVMRKRGRTVYLRPYP
eukprot:4739749-Pleurochrysis_carterae.AAC.2